MRGSGRRIFLCHVGILRIADCWGLASKGIRNQAGHARDHELLLGFAFAILGGSIGVTIVSGIGGLILFSYLHMRFIDVENSQS